MLSPRVPSCLSSPVCLLAAPYGSISLCGDVTCTLDLTDCLGSWLTLPQHPARVRRLKCHPHSPRRLTMVRPPRTRSFAVDPSRSAGGSDYIPQMYASSRRHHRGYGEPSSSQSARSPPRVPRPMRDDRSVTPPPPQAPSSSYLSLSEQDPSRVNDPMASRKLLVLDLNGTLLHRSAHIFRPKSRTAAEEDRKRDRHGNFLPRLRPVHPRPYMPAFREYLFHPRTRAWLDVMVWSSAQPHSVGDMVDKCFGEHKDDLLAVWARDTLGLPTEHYCKLHICAYSFTISTPH